MLLQAEVEDLAFVVLYHELAHAYRMAGNDIDGGRGGLQYPTYQSEKYATEGLAQYYIEAICSQLEGAYTSYMVAFNALLAR